MSDVICLVCTHGPHKSGPCAACGCKQFVNSTVSMARSVVMIANEIPTFKAMVVDIMELLMEAFPDAVLKVDEKRAQLRAQQEKANESTTPAADRGGSGVIEFPEPAGGSDSGAPDPSESVESAETESP